MAPGHEAPGAFTMRSTTAYVRTATPHGRPIARDATPARGAIGSGGNNAAASRGPHGKTALVSRRRGAERLRQFWQKLATSEQKLAAAERRAKLAEAENAALSKAMEQAEKRANSIEESLRVMDGERQKAEARI